MAVEVRELVVKATVVKNDEYMPENARTPNEKAQIVQECVREVLKIIAKSKNR